MHDIHMVVTQAKVDRSTTGWACCYGHAVGHVQHQEGQGPLLRLHDRGITRTP